MTPRAACIATALAPLALLIAGAAPADTSSQSPSLASRISAAGPPPAFGLAHVDLMDLHLERLPGGGVRRREVLAQGELEERFEMAAASGAAWNRWSLYWDMVDDESGFDWSVPDEIVGRDRAAGLRTLAILQGTPARHATSGNPSVVFPRVGGNTPNEIATLSGSGPAAVQASVPRSLYEPAFLRADGSPTDDPAEAAQANPANPWSSFVVEAVERYRPGGTLAGAQGWAPGEGVSAWEIGNEPNLGHFWAGSPAEFARYLEVAFLAVEWRDPGATVVHGGIADDASAADWYGRFLDALVQRGTESPLPERYSYYFDAAGWHWYSYPALLGSGPERARGLVRDRGLPVKPIWVTEMGVPIWSEHPGPCWDPTSPWRATAVEQAGYVWQALAEGASSGVEVAIHFQTYDDCGNGPESYDAFGLVRNHASNQCWTPPEGQACWRFDPEAAGEPRPAYDAFSAATELIGPAQPLWRSGRVDDWERVLLFLPPDKRVTVAWNWSRSDRTVGLAATGPEGTLVSMDPSGNVSERTSRPSGGQHTVTLPGQTNRNNPGGGGVMAGLPVILVERDEYAPYRAEIEALPEVSPETFDLTVSGADGGTGVGAVRVLVAERPPAGPADWQVWAGEVAWTGTPISGRQSVPFAGEPGRTYYFAAQARDRAGNWTEPPPAAQATTRIDGEGPVPTPTHAPTDVPTYVLTAVPTYMPTDVPTVPPTFTPSPVTPTRVASPTPAAPTASPGPPPVLDKSILLPTAIRGGPLCALLGAAVHGPRGDLLSDPRGRWTLRSLAADDSVSGSTQPLGTSACARADAMRIEAWAVVPGFVTDAPQDLSLSGDLYLAVAPNTLLNGGFEAGLAGWVAGGDLPALSSSAALAGAGAALLGSGGSSAPGTTASADSALHQELVVPSLSPTLSLRYRFVSDRECGADGCRDVDRVHVRVVDLDDPQRQDLLLTGQDGIGSPSPDWAHASYDLESAAGRRVRLEVELAKADRAGPGRLWLDNVSIGPARPGAMEGSLQ